MKQSTVKEIVKEFKTQIESIACSRLKHVILFGSFARGDAVVGSDIDLLLIFDSKIPADMIRKIKEISNYLSLKYDVVISEFLFTEEEFKKYKTPFLLNVKKEGIKVW